jgi:hypothetical protein
VSIVQYLIFSLFAFFDVLRDAYSISFSLTCRTIFLFCLSIGYINSITSRAYQVIPRITILLVPYNDHTIMETSLYSRIINQQYPGFFILHVYKPMFSATYINNLSITSYLACYASIHTI